ncbi:MAG: hypothetical protein ACTS22_08345 [Phycisphaerales bacterium]
MNPDARLIDWLREADEPCPVCRYSLRGVQHPRCPECGAGLELAVRSPDLRVAPWALSVVSLAMALGFDAVMVLLVVALFARHGVPRLGSVPFHVWATYGFLVGATVVLTVALMAMFRLRPAMQRRRPVAQWAIAAGVGGVVSVSHLLVGGWFLSFVW